MASSVPSTIRASEDLTRQVAKLARLELSNDEVQTFTTQLNDILAYVSELQAVNVEGVEPLTHPFELPTAFREDVVIPPLQASDGSPAMLSSAPDALDSSFKVPPIL